MASIFLELIKMAVAIKKIPNSNFKKKCIGIFNKRWAQFDTDTYLVAYFLHPKYRGKFNYFCLFYLLYFCLFSFFYFYLAMGIQDKAFRQLCLNAMKIWSKFGNNSVSCKILLSQFRKYSENKPPYDMDYIDEYDFLDTPELWWITCRQPNNYIQQLALKLFAITPHQAACERVFSVLDWMIGNRRIRYLCIL